MNKKAARKAKNECSRLSAQEIKDFQRTIYRYYRRNGRVFAWRQTSDPYEILVSEFMLQQTQTKRVVPKYELFLEKFPDIQELAAASLRDVFTVWQGLGYNRRAKALRETARVVTTKYDGCIPSDVASLISFPGIGPASAAAISAFAFNQPATLLETNIRRVFIHFFFPECEAVKDSEILPLLEATLDRSHPRRWYYALMDYGVMLKKGGQNANRRSAHYQKQPPFKGSNRELRGCILKTLQGRKRMTQKTLLEKIGADAGRATKALIQLKDEGFLMLKGKYLALLDG
jgi:A/G-specific adenine glycosylase